MNILLKERKEQAFKWALTRDLWFIKDEIVLSGNLSRKALAVALSSIVATNVSLPIVIFSFIVSVVQLFKQSNPSAIAKMIFMQTIY